MAHKNSHPKPPEVCPVCGEDVPPKALACLECGADHNSGWREDSAIYDGLDLPDDEFLENEFGPKTKSLKLVWWITAVIVLAAAIGWFILGLLQPGNV